jgi:hypothetical protein
MCKRAGLRLALLVLALSAGNANARNEAFVAAQVHDGHEYVERWTVEKVGRPTDPSGLSGASPR